MYNEIFHVVIKVLRFIFILRLPLCMSEEATNRRILTSSPIQSAHGMLCIFACSGTYEFAQFSTVLSWFT